MSRHKIVCLFFLTVSLLIGSGVLGAAPGSLFDDLESLDGWQSSGAEAEVTLSTVKTQGSYSLRFGKSTQDSDYVRITKELSRPRKLAGYDCVTMQLYVPNPNVIKKASVWFGERDRWIGGCLHDLPPLVKGWNDVSLDLFNFSLHQSGIDVWDRIRVFSVEINTGDPRTTSAGFLIDDIRFWKSNSQELQNHPLVPKDAPLARLAGKPFFPLGLYSVSIQTVRRSFLQADFSAHGMPHEGDQQKGDDDGKSPKELIRPPSLCAAVLPICIWKLRLPGQAGARRFNRHRSRESSDGAALLQFAGQWRTTRHASVTSTICPFVLMNRRWNKAINHRVHDLYAEV